MAKIEPAVTQLAYLVPDGTSYIDIAKDLSMVNRRLYRQGYTYVVQDIQLGISSGLRSTDVAVMTMSTMGNSWMVHNAWKKAYQAWRQQQRDVKAALGAEFEGKWADFKIYLDDTHEDGTILEPYAGDGAVYIAGEWAHSKFVFDDDGTERELKMHMIGSSNLADTNNESGVGLIHEYARSRARVSASEPDLSSEASDTIYAKMMATDEMSDMLVDNLEGDNDETPYSRTEYPGGDTNADSAVPVRFFSASGTQTTTTSPGFIAPCGLIKIDASELNLTLTTESATDLGDVGGTGVASPGPLSIYQVGTAQTQLLIVTVAPGPYRGVLAAPMGQ